MSGIGCRKNDSCQKQYGKGNFSSSQHLHSSIYAFSTFTTLQNTDIWNKPGFLPLGWFESPSHSAAAPSQKVKFTDGGSAAFLPHWTAVTPLPLPKPKAQPSLSQLPFIPLCRPTTLPGVRLPW